MLAHPRALPVLTGSKSGDNALKAGFAIPLGLIGTVVPLVVPVQYAWIGGGVFALLVGLPFMLYGIAWISRALESRAVRLIVEPMGLRIAGGRADGRTIAWHELAPPGVWLEEVPIRRFTFWRVWSACVLGSLCFVFLLVAAGATTSTTSLDVSWWSLRRPTPSTKLWLLSHRERLLVATTSDPEEMQAMRGAFAELSATLHAMTAGR